ncbi:MAG: asparagine synthase-related protein [Deltaproteobacteria bacterium]
MPNLVGLYDPTATAEALDTTLERMMTAVDYPAFGFERRMAKAEGMACGNVLPGIEDNLAQPARHGDVWLMLDGELLGLEPLKRALRERGLDPKGDDAQLALLAYRAFGLDFVDHLNGCWNIVVHDGDVTYVITDRHGSRLLFFANDGARYVFANELKGVVVGRNRKSSPGSVGLMQLLSAGGHAGQVTWVDGIELIPPGTIVALSDGVRQHRYYKLRFNEGRPSMSEGAYAEGFAHHLAEATARSMKLADRHPMAITLSGGLDSRAVALTIPSRHLPIDSITYGGETSADVRYAAELAKVIGFRHHYIEPEAQRLIDEGAATYQRLTGRTDEFGFFSSQVDRIIWRCEALSLFDGLSSLLWHPIYKPLMHFMLNGAAGDAMTGSHITPNLMLSPTREEVKQDLLGRAFFQDDDRLRALFTPAFYARYRDARDPSFLADFDAIDADEPTAVANVWDMENRQRRGAFTSFAIERYFCTCRSPFLDYDLIDFLADVPAAWRFQQRVYKKMLVEHHPRAAHVPWAYTEGRITSNPAYEFAREVFNFAKRKMKEKLPSRRGQQAHYFFRDHPKLLKEDAALHRYLVDFTRRDDFPSDVLQAEGIRALSERFARDGVGKDYALFTHLVGIAKSMEQFMTPDEVFVPAVADPSEFGVPR